MTFNDNRKSRRAFLRGAGVALAMPLFTSARTARAAVPFQMDGTCLATTVTGAPLRSLFVFFPNGAIPKAWWPEVEGADYPQSRTLQPLEPCKAHVQVMGGLDHHTAEAGPDGAGDHARGGGTFLTGVRLNK